MQKTIDENKDLLKFNAEGVHPADMFLMIGNTVMNYLMILLLKRILFGVHQRVKILITKWSIQFFHLIKKENLKFLT